MSLLVKPKKKINIPKKFLNLDFVDRDVIEEVWEILKDGQWHRLDKIEPILKKHKTSLFSVGEALNIAEDEADYLCIDMGEGITPLTPFDEYQYMKVRSSGY
jgi:hypothetical protein